MHVTGAGQQVIVQPFFDTSLVADFVTCHKVDSHNRPLYSKALIALILTKSSPKCLVRIA